MNLLLLVLALGIGTRPTTAQNPAESRSTPLTALTLGADGLPPGCTLAPSPVERLDQQRVRMGLWAGFPSNPWTGTDAGLIASIRPFLDVVPEEPDGPPMNTAERARYQSHLADGVDAGYSAVYRQPGGALIVVRALQFASGNVPPIDLHANRGQRPIAIGRIVAVVTGEPGTCFDAVRRHVESLAK